MSGIQRDVWWCNCYRLLVNTMVSRAQGGDVWDDARFLNSPKLEATVGSLCRI